MLIGEDDVCKALVASTRCAISTMPPIVFILDVIIAMHLYRDDADQSTPANATQIDYCVWHLCIFRLPDVMEDEEADGKSDLTL